MCYAGVFYKEAIVVMDVSWRRLCVGTILEIVIYFFLSWARVRRMRRVSVYSELMCGGGARSNLLLPLVDRCIDNIKTNIYKSGGWNSLLQRTIIVKI